MSNEKYTILQILTIGGSKIKIFEIFKNFNFEEHLVSNLLFIPKNCEWGADPGGAWIWKEWGDYKVDQMIRLSSVVTHLSDSTLYLL